jgi:hypothetical protein
MIGLGYFIVVIIFAPWPNASHYSFFLVSFYSGFIILAQYLYQFPCFDRFNCSPGTNNAQGLICEWFAFAGLQKVNTNLGSILYIHMLILFSSIFQKVTLVWKRKLGDKVS